MSALPAFQLHARCAAMGSWFEAVLLGDDEEHLEAVAAAIWDEVRQVERLLSRHDPQAEVYRLNHAAPAGRPITVGYELLAILQDCEAHRQATAGAFDVAWRGRDPADGAGRIELDPVRRTVRFRSPDVQLDFGAYGKGYALDRAVDVLRAHHVERAFVHGGTSSAVALGEGPGGTPWPIDLRDPFADDESVAFDRLALANLAFSCSAVYGTSSASAGESDIVNPRRQGPLAHQGGCVVLHPSATVAEVLSTACLAMGEPAASRWARTAAATGATIGWIAQGEGRTQLRWLVTDPQTEHPEHRPMLEPTP